MSSPFIGQFMLVGFNYAPRGWAFCHGQLLSISQNQTLFALLGTYYGGDGRTTFGLPDLRGRTPLGHGQGPGLSSRSMGQVVGSETVTLSQAQMPPHNHPISASSKPGLTETPGAAVAPAGGGSYGEPLDSDLRPTGTSGGGTPVGIVQPGLVLNYIIALQGLFPSRS